MSNRRDYYRSPSRAVWTFVIAIVAGAAAGILVSLVIDAIW